MNVSDEWHVLVYSHAASEPERARVALAFQRRNPITADIWSRLHPPPPARIDENPPLDPAVTECPGLDYSTS